MTCISSRCQFDTILAQATAIDNLIGQTIKNNGGTIDPETYTSILVNNAAANPQAVSRLNEANAENEATCAGAWTYSDEKKNYICINPKQDDVPINSTYRERYPASPAEKHCRPIRRA
jgi:hypothetical protein